MTAKLFDVRLWMVLLVVTAVMLAKGWSASSSVMEYISMDADNYPAMDCGKNDFLMVRFTSPDGKQSCVPTNAWSKDCIGYWVRRYTDDWWRKNGGDVAAASEALGMPVMGPMNIIDEVYFGLIRGAIRCP